VIPSMNDVFIRAVEEANKNNQTNLRKEEM
jgi:hypothetical protein